MLQVSFLKDIFLSIHRIRIFNKSSITSLSTGPNGSTVVEDSPRSSSPRPQRVPLRPRIGLPLWPRQNTCQTRTARTVPITSSVVVEARPSRSQALLLKLLGQEPILSRWLSQRRWVKYNISLVPTTFTKIWSLFCVCLICQTTGGI